MRTKRSKQRQSSTVVSVVSLASRKNDGSNRRLLTQLFQEDADHKVAGLVLVTLFNHGEQKGYSVRLSGLAEENPTLAVGAMASCQALLETAALIEAGLLPRE